MMAVDTSALIAMLQNEPLGLNCEKALSTETEPKISAATMAETLVVAARRGFESEMIDLIDSIGFEVISATAATARRVMDIYRRWGKGVHPAALNFGDCFAYDVAETFECPLLYVGKDFSRTDIRSVLSNKI